MLTSVQLVPFHSSVSTFWGSLPPKATAAEVVPAPAIRSLAVFMSFTSVQFVPLKVSVTPVYGGVSPPKPIVAVETPAPPKPALAVFKSLTSVQFVPL